MFESFRPDAEDGPSPQPAGGKRDERVMAESYGQETKQQPSIVPEPPVVVENHNRGESDPEEFVFHGLVSHSGRQRGLLEGPLLVEVFKKVSFVRLVPLNDGRWDRPQVQAADIAPRHQVPYQLR